MFKDNHTSNTLFVSKSYPPIYPSRNESQQLFSLLNEFCDFRSKIHNEESECKTQSHSIRKTSVSMENNILSKDDRYTVDTKISVSDILSNRHSKFSQLETKVVDEFQVTKIEKEKLDSNNEFIKTKVNNCVDMNLNSYPIDFVPKSELDKFEFVPNSVTPPSEHEQSSDELIVHKCHSEPCVTRSNSNSKYRRDISPKVPRSCIPSHKLRSSQQEHLNRMLSSKSISVDH